MLECCISHIRTKVSDSFESKITAMCIAIKITGIESRCFLLQEVMLVASRDYCRGHNESSCGAN